MRCVFVVPANMPRHFASQISMTVIFKRISITNLFCETGNIDKIRKTGKSWV